MKPELSPEQYEIERAICDKASAFWKANATFSRNGWSSMGPELAAHPDYAACSNDMRGRVEQFEILRDLPEVICAYVSSDARSVTVWTGLPIGTCRAVSSWPTPRSCIGSRMYQFHATIGGRDYTGRGYGEGMCIALRETAASKRKRGAV